MALPPPHPSLATYRLQLWMFISRATGNKTILNNQLVKICKALRIMTATSCTYSKCESLVLLLAGSILWPFQAPGSVSLLSPFNILTSYFQCSNDAQLFFPLRNILKFCQKHQQDRGCTQTFYLWIKAFPHHLGKFIPLLLWRNNQPFVNNLFSLSFTLKVLETEASDCANQEGPLNQGAGCLPHIPSPPISPTPTLRAHASHSWLWELPEDSCLI